MAVWSSVKLSKMTRTLRLDAEYYQPHLLRYERELRASGLSVRKLGDVVKDGYRVVYEATKLLEVDAEGPPKGAVRFLQADDVQARFPAINPDSVGWVSRKDWDRYVKGRIIPGELLIEVKGQARKVAIVPEDWPTETLVTGSLFKLQADEAQIDRYFLLCYLLSEYGVGFRSRCLTNTLIGFVSKDDLYEIPVPVPKPKAQLPIAALAKRAIAMFASGRKHLIEAEHALLTALGLDGLDLKASLC